MVLADLGRKINGAIQSMSKASVIDDKVRSAYRLAYHSREWFVNGTFKWAQDSDINNNSFFNIIGRRRDVEGDLQGSHGV